MIPISTDAPIYHRPIGTLALIALCLLAFFLVPWDPLHHEVAIGLRNANNGANAANRAPDNQEKPQWREADFEVEAEEDAGEIPITVNLGRSHRFSNLRLRLHPGSLNPLQWFTSPLLHDSFVVLLINLISLWAFGLIVEGKVGTRVFLMLFFLLGAGQAGFYQLVMLAHSGPPVAGAGGAILGLIGIAVVWAPKNSLDVWWGPYLGVHEISILIFGFIEFAFGMLALDIEVFLSQTLALGVGLGLGFLWLRRDWVDCEGWDLVSVMRNEHDKPNRSAEDQALEREAQNLVRRSLASPDQDQAAPPNKRQVPPPEIKSKRTSKTARRNKKKPNETTEQEIQLTAAQRLEIIRGNIESLILEGNYNTALKMLEKLELAETPVELSQPALAKLLRDLLAAKDFQRAIPVIQEHLSRFSIQKTALQFNLAKIFIHLERPKKALALLRSMDRDDFNQGETQKWRQLATFARQQIEDGIIELSDT